MNAEGIKSSAILLMALGQEHAAEIFKFLGPREVQKVGAAMAALKNLTREQVSETLEMFVRDSESQTAFALDSDDYLRSVLTSALGEDKAGQVLERILGGSETTGIEGLKWLDAASVAELVKKEHPQIIATVLVHLDADQACEVVSSFPERLRNDVLLRIATLDGIQPIALRELDDVLRDLLSGGDTIRRSPIGGAGAAAEIINFMQSAFEQSVLDNVREYDSDLAQEILDKMFTFDNLQDLDNAAIQLLMKEIDAQTLIVAIKGADAQLRQKFVGNMSKRSAELFVEDINAMGPVRVSEVEEKQREILQVVRKLAEEGQIVIGKRPEDAYVS
ncbi:flagellar motor switch protein FliG [Burkholderia sp. lig30]|uniref:flagellar motor switch protein FliG n=1 Tax=Burkholderia sp. lig30 TaxID=1192124 RepID=UPI000460C8B0|nr:flagellar motor switch protein FliG [Burkholderia sp. lig30]KDB07778.1 flagellar motor switch protein FliG [Burkholderia sp. lig30]